MSKLNIQQVELRVSQTLQSPLKVALEQAGYVVPDGYRLCVSLVDAHGRKKRSTAGADNWSPDSGKLEFRLEPFSEPLQSDVKDAQMQHASPSEGQATAASALSGDMQPALAELIAALQRAESTPGWNFVSLKKFRDEILPYEDFKWLRGQPQQQNVLRFAIENKLVLTNKVANPKDPRFPVTAIRLNRMRPEVQSVLGLPKVGFGFHPIRIKGEPLSDTVLRERR